MVSMLTLCLAKLRQNIDNLCLSLMFGSLNYQVVSDVITEVAIIWFESSCQVPRQGFASPVLRALFDLIITAFLIQFFKIEIKQY